MNEPFKTGLLVVAGGIVGFFAITFLEVGVRKYLEKRREQGTK